jgi:hypothetical protein
MAKYKNLSDDFYEATKRLAQTWRTESIGWQDEKAKQFSERVMLPVSNECGRINELLVRMDAVLSRLDDANLINEK